MVKKSLSQATYCSEAEYLANTFNSTVLVGNVVRRSQRLIDKSHNSCSKNNEESMNYNFSDHHNLENPMAAAIRQDTYQISVSKRKYYVGKSRSPQLFDQLDDNINNSPVQQQMECRDLSDSSLPLGQTTKRRKLKITTKSLMLRSQVKKPRGKAPNNILNTQSKNVNVKQKQGRGQRQIKSQGNFPIVSPSVKRTGIKRKTNSGSTIRKSLVYSKTKKENKLTMRNLKYKQKLEQAQGNAPVRFLTDVHSSVNRNQNANTSRFVLSPIETYCNPAFGNKNATSSQSEVCPQRLDGTRIAAGKSTNSDVKAINKTNKEVPLSTWILSPIERYYKPPPTEEKHLSAAGINNKIPHDFDGPKSVNPNNMDSFKPYHDAPIEEKPVLAAGVINSPSLLPAVYPSHFVYQLPPAASTTLAGSQQKLGKSKTPNQQLPQVPDMYFESETAFITDLDRDLSPSPQLSESWNEIFGGKSLREVLNIEPIRYRLTEEQLSAVALILNVEVARLRGVMNLVQRLPQSDVKKMASEINESTNVTTTADSAFQLSNEMNLMLQNYELNKNPSIFNTQQEKNYVTTG